MSHIISPKKLVSFIGSRSALLCNAQNKCVGISVKKSGVNVIDTLNKKTMAEFKDCI
jgi:hypothetical protein